MRIRNFQRIPTVAKASLKASFDVELPSGMILLGCMLFVGPSGQAWASPPSKPQIDSRNQVMKNKAGKRLYQATVSFADRLTELRWSASVISALAVGCPDLVTADHVTKAKDAYRRETAGLDRAGRVHAEALGSLGMKRQAAIDEAKCWQDGDGLKEFEDMVAKIRAAA